MYIKLKQQHKWTTVCLNLEKHKENGVIRIRDSLVGIPRSGFVLQG